MKKLFALLAAVLAVVSCQKDVDNLDVNVGGAVDTVITVNIPENETRANNSGIGVFENGILESDDYTMRYIFQVYYRAEDGTVTKSTERQVKYSDGTSVSFPVRLIPGRDYQFVVWADVVTSEDDTDNHYNTANLEAVSVIESSWNAMDETRDAFTASYAADDYNGSQSININLYRPFAKLRVIATDYDELAKIGIEVKKAAVNYTTVHRSTFNAYDSVAVETNVASIDKDHSTYEIATYTNETGDEHTIFSDYFFAENDVVKFEITVYDQNDAEIVTRALTTDIYAKRNYLTTIKGDILTDGNNVNVEVKPGFGDDEIKWPNTPAGELAKAAMLGGEVTLTEDVVLEESLNVTANLVINLNGNTITGAFVKNDGALIENNGILKIVGGTLKNTYTNGDAVINNSGELVLDDVKIEGAPIGETGYPNYAVYSSGKLIINNDTQITSDRGVLNMSNGADVTINGGEFVVTDEVGTRVLTAHVIYAYGSSSKLTINNGSFQMNIGNGGGTSVICPAGATIKVYGGDFYHKPVADVQSGCFQNYMGYGAPVDVYGGTFNDDTVTKSGNLAEGYKAVQSGDKYMVVKEDVGGVATDNATLDTAIQNAQDGDTIALNAGEYVIPDSAGGKTITFVGTGAPEDTLITAQNDGAAEGNCDYSLRGSKATFENVTITTTGTYFPGYAGCQGTYKNCIINGVFTLYDSSSFEDCTFNISGDLYNVWTWGAAEATFTNCTFNCDGKAMLLYGQANTKLTMNDCVFNDNGDDTVTGKAAIEIGNDYNKSYELTVNNATVNGFAINPNGFVTGTTLWANKNSMKADKLKVTVDGKNAYNYVAAADDTQSFTEAINNGATEIALSNGNYTMPEPDLRGKTLKISGTWDVVIDATAVDTRDQFVTGANISFEGVTVNFGNVNYMGFANAASLSYKNCKINGLQFLNGPVATFENCEFNSNGAEHSVWTYGCKEVNFIDCDFTYADRCVNCYKDQDIDGGKQTVNFTECTFTTTNTASEGAVEINSCFFSVGIEVNLNGCTAPAYGQMAYVSPWDSTNGAKTTINIQ